MSDIPLYYLATDKGEADAGFTTELYVGPDAPVISKWGEWEGQQLSEQYPMMAVLHEPPVPPGEVHTLLDLSALKDDPTGEKGTEALRLLLEAAGLADYLDLRRDCDDGQCPYEITLDGCSYEIYNVPQQIKESVAILAACFEIERRHPKESE